MSSSSGKGRNLTEHIQLYRIYEPTRSVVVSEAIIPNLWAILFKDGIGSSSGRSGNYMQAMGSLIEGGPLHSTPLGTLLWAGETKSDYCCHLWILSPCLLATRRHISGQFSLQNCLVWPWDQCLLENIQPFYQYNVRERGPFRTAQFLKLSVHLSYQIVSF